MIKYFPVSETKLTYNILSFYFSLLIVFLLPPFLYVGLKLDSPTLGIILSILLAWAIQIKSLFIIKINKNLILGSFMILSILSVFSANSLVSGSYKSILSVIIFFFMLTFALVLHAQLKRLNNIEFYSVIRFLVLTLLFIGYVGTVIHLESFNYDSKPKSIFPFAEPSHYSLLAGIIFIGFLPLATKVGKIFILLSMLVFGIFFPNVTILMYFLIGVNLLSKWYWSVVILMLVVLSLFILFSFDNEILAYYSSRVMLTPDSDNLTALVYMQGWQEMWEALVQTNGLGLGFQLNGTQIPSNLAEKVRDIAGIYKNREDGAFLAGKIISEFGVLGVIFVLFLIRLTTISFVFLKDDVMKSTPDIKLIFAHAIVFSFLVELFIRSTGYFTPTLIIFLMSLFYINRPNIGVKL